MHVLLYDKYVLLRYGIYTNCPASLSHEILRVTAIRLVANEVHVHHVTRIARIYMTFTFLPYNLCPSCPRPESVVLDDF